MASTMPESATDDVRDLDPDVDDARGPLWPRPAAVGAVLALAGVAAIASGALVGPATPMLLGIILIAAGASEILGGVTRAHERGAALTIGGGAISIAAGAVLLARADRGLDDLVGVLGIFFFTAGLFRIVSSMIARYPRWGWDLGAGVATALLGVYALGGWPVPSLRAASALAGLELLVRGVVWIGSAAAAHLALTRGAAGFTLPRRPRATA